MEYISNKIYLLSSQPFEKFVSSKKYSRKMLIKYLPFMLFHPYTLISQILKHVEIYTYIFFPPSIYQELSFYTRELILCHITSRSTCNKRQRVVMAQYLTGQSERRVIFLRGKTLDKNFDIINEATYCAVARVQRVEIFSFNKWFHAHCASSKRITVITSSSRIFHIVYYKT